MKRVAKFEKVSLSQFTKDWIDTFGNRPEDIITEIYENIKLPERKTIDSAGYDFSSPKDFTLQPNSTIRIPTGIKVCIDKGWVLKCYPRSGLGFKYRLRLDNTVAVIDGDYYYSDNEGHIFLKLTNETNEAKILKIKAGDGIAQGVFVEYGITYDDEAQGVRNGGFGSTDRYNMEQFVNALSIASQQIEKGANIETTLGKI